MTDREHAQKLREIELDPEDPFALSRWCQAEARRGVGRQDIIAKLAAFFVAKLDSCTLPLSIFRRFKKAGLGNPGWTENDLILRAGLLKVPEGLSDLNELGWFFGRKFEEFTEQRVREEQSPEDTFKILAENKCGRSYCSEETRRLHGIKRLPNGVGKIWEDCGG